jgi:hypothetical protein
MMRSSSKIRMDDNVYCQEPQRNFLNDLSFAICVTTLIITTLCIMTFSAMTVNVKVLIDIQQNINNDTHHDDNLINTQ